MSRTDELRDSGAEQVAGGGGGGDRPWFRWPEHHANVEGVLLDTFTTKYGVAGVFKMISWEPEGLEASPGRNEPNVKLDEGMEVNVPLYYKTLEGVTQHRLGHRLHVAFSGWERNEGGTKYRVFEAFNLGPVERFLPENRDEADGGERSGAETSGDEELPPSARMESREKARSGGGPGAPGAESPPVDDNLPF